MKFLGKDIFKKKREKPIKVYSFSPSTGTVNAQLRRMRISAIAKPTVAASGSPAPPIDKRQRQVLGVLPKRISLPENLEFQPQKLLNIKQSIHVEKQISGETTVVSDSKQAIKARFQQQQHKRKSRMQLLRQQVKPSNYLSFIILKQKFLEQLSNGFKASMFSYNAKSMSIIG